MLGHERLEGRGVMEQWPTRTLKGVERVVFVSAAPVHAWPSPLDGWEVHTRHAVVHAEQSDGAQLSGTASVDVLS